MQQKIYLLNAFSEFSQSNMKKCQVHCGTPSKIWAPKAKNCGTGRKHRKGSQNSPLRKMYRENRLFSIFLGHPLTVKIVETDSSIYS